MCGLGFTVGCYHAVKEGVSSVNRDSKNLISASIGNEMRCDDEEQSVCQGM